LVFAGSHGPGATEPTIDDRRGVVFSEGGVLSMGDEQEDTMIYKVVVNHEEQYSIWPANRENALGWRDAGKEGLKSECLAYIQEVWTDMRPLSLRQKMGEA
jgi:MbtH protein